MGKVPAKVALLRQMVRDDVPVLFGNPGTVEEGLLDALSDVPEVRYVMGLQESVVAAMADGYARSRHKVAVAQVHAAVGLGNAMAILYQASRSWTPIVVLAGEAYSRHHAYDGFLAGDTVRMAEPVSKWSYRVTHGDQVLPVFRRALKVANTPPQGPVFLSLPMDVLDEIVTDDGARTTFVDVDGQPTAEAADDIARALAKAERPLLLVGDQVLLSDAREDLRELSERVGIPVYGVDFAELSASFRDPFFMGLVGHAFGDNTRRITLGRDVIVTIGTPMFPELFPSDEAYFDEGARVFHIDLDDWELAKNFAVERAVRAAPKGALRAILGRVDDHLPEGHRARLEERRNEAERAKQESRARLDAEFDATASDEPMPPSRMMKEIAENLPDDVLVYDESITSTDELLHYLQPDKEGSYLLGRGGCIGVGWPGAVGASIAHPGRPVLALSGDGSALYVVQALWTAAREQLPIVFAVCANRSYRILKVNILRYWEELGEAPGQFPPFDLTDPAPDFCRIAEGFGVPARRVTSGDALGKAVLDAFDTEGPYLLEVEIDGAVPVPGARPIVAHSGPA